MKPYLLLLSETVLHQFPRGIRQRAIVERFFRQIVAFPHVEPSYWEDDPEWGSVQVRTFEKFAISYYVDDAVKRVTILSIVPLDS